MATAIRSRIIRIVVSVSLLALVFAFADWRAVWSALHNVSPVWVVCALLLAVADRVALNYRWQILLAARGIAMGFARLFRIQLAANFLGSFLPSFIGIDAVRIGALCRAGEPPTAVIAATLVDRASIAFATLLLGAATTLVFAHERLPPNVVKAVLAATAFAILVSVVCLQPAVRRWVRLSLLPRMPERLRHTVATIADASLAYRHDARTITRVIAATAVVFFIRLLFAKSVVLASGADVAFTDLLLIVPIIWIVVMLPITVGALGVQDAAYVVLMSFVGVSAPLAVSMSLIEHVVVRLAVLPGAFFLGEIAAKRSSPKLAT